MKNPFYFISAVIAILLGFTVMVNKETGWGILFVVLGLVLLVKGVLK